MVMSDLVTSDVTNFFLAGAGATLIGLLFLWRLGYHRAWTKVAALLTR